MYGSPKPAVIRSGLLGATFALIVIMAFSGGHVDRMTLSDGLIARRVASNLAATPAEVPPQVVERGTSLRYGRIGLPAALWLASAGQPGAMPYVQPLLMIIVAAVASITTVQLVGKDSPAVVLAPFLAIGFFLSVAGGFGDALGIALGLVAVVAATRERWWWASATLAAAILTRENAGAVLIGLCVWCALGARWRQMAILTTSLVPVVMWHAFVFSRYGHFPLLDPYLATTTDAVRPPIVATILSFRSGDGAAIAVLSVHLALAIVALAIWKRSVLGAIAAAAALQVLMAGPFAWKYIGEATRALSFLQVFLVLAIIKFEYRKPAEVPV